MVDRQFLRTLSSLYLAQAASALIPLFLIPYLARELEPEAWAMVLLAQAFGIWGGILIDYGFNLSATRELARTQNGIERAKIFYAVLAAKLLIALLIIPIGVGAFYFISAFHSKPEYLIGGIVLALLQGFDLMWYFQGIERPGFYSVLVAGSRLIMAAATVAFVKSKNDGMIAIALQAVAMFVVLCIGGVVTMATAKPQSVSVREVNAELKRGWTMFVFRSFVSLYTTGNTVIFALFAPPIVVGAYANGEKITRQGLSLLSPLAQASFPRISRLVSHDMEGAERHARANLYIMTTIGVLACGVIWVAAPLIVSLLLGPLYGAVVPVMRILAPMVPLVAISNVMGIQWMIPLKLDRSFNMIIIIAGLFNLLLVVLLAPHFRAAGMAAAVVCSEAFVTTSMFIVVERNGYGLLTKRQKF